jgi:hypothetical protein
MRTQAGRPANEFVEGAVRHAKLVTAEVFVVHTQTAVVANLQQFVFIA